jgi:hypothetical protein
VQHKFSGLEELETCYAVDLATGMDDFFKAYEPSWLKQSYPDFQVRFRKARALVISLEQELLSRELPVIAQLSFATAADELDKAQMLLDEGKGDEPILRASGVVARVALERHLFTVADERGLIIVRNPPSKKKPDVDDVLNTLTKANIITAIQRAHLNSLFSIANNCAHPKEAVRIEDVQRLITDGRSAAAVIT